MKKILMMSIMGIVLFCSGAGIGYYFSGSPASPSSEVLRLIEMQGDSGSLGKEMGNEPQKEMRANSGSTEFATSYFEFPDPLTTNVKNSSKFAQISVGISTQYGEDVIENVSNHAIALRSDLLAVLSELEENDLEGPESRAALSEVLKNTMNDRLVRLEGFGGVEGVFFSSFVVQ